MQSSEEDFFYPYLNSSVEDPITGLGIDENINESVHANGSGEVYQEIPAHYTQMSENSKNLIIAYSIIFVISTAGNISVFYTIFRQLKKSKTRITLLILHLSIADLFSTFGIIPLEIAWKITIQFLAGNFACKTCLFFKAFGLYLSSNVLICICFDRYFAIVHPLAITDALKRRKIMLICSWILAAICSAPQSIIFSIQHHPIYKSFKQCVAIGFFSTIEKEMAYTLFSVFMMYFLPLFVIIFTYGRILFKIARKSNQPQQSLNDGSDEPNPNEIRRVTLRRNEATKNLLIRAKNKTLKLTVTIIIAFLACWTPYVVMTLWYMFGRESAKKVDERIQDVLFMMAVANSCVNPFIYFQGSSGSTLKDAFCKCCKKSAPPQINGTSGVWQKDTAATRTLRTNFRSNRGLGPPRRNLDEDSSILEKNRQSPADNINAMELKDNSGVGGGSVKRRLGSSEEFTGNLAKHYHCVHDLKNSSHSHSEDASPFL